MPAALLPAHGRRQQVLCRRARGRSPAVSWWSSCTASSCRGRSPRCPGSAGQLAADLVGDAVGEVVVLGSSEVLEREDRDALDAGAAAPRRAPPEEQPRRASTTSAAPAIASLLPAPSAAPTTCAPLVTRRRTSTSPRARRRRPWPTGTGGSGPSPGSASRCGRAQARRSSRLRQLRRSSLRIAAIVSLAVSRLNALLPESIS